MARFLLKSDPDTYGFADLVHDGRTVWDGVANPVAVKHLASMRKGDELVVYHTGKERAAVGLATVVGGPGDDPKDPKVEIAAGRPLKAPIPLDSLKTNPLFAESPLLRMGRLSVVPLTDAQYQALAK